MLSFQLSHIKRTDAQYISSSREHRASNCSFLPLFICVFHLSVQSTVDKGLCKGCLRTRRSSSSIFFEVVFWSISIVNLERSIFQRVLTETISSQGHIEPSVLLFQNQIFCENVCVPKCFKIIQIQLGLLRWWWQAKLNVNLPGGW